MIERVLIDIDNTVYEYEPAHRSGLVAAHGSATPLLARWKSEKEFCSDYAAARDAVHSEIAGTAASHNRFLYFKRMLEHAGLGHRVSQALRMEDRYREGYFQHLTAYPHAYECLAWLKGMKVEVVWVSNLTARLQAEKLVALGLDGLGRLLTSEETGRDKPAAVNFERALAGSPPEKALMIGDDWECDIEPAHQLGLRAIWLSTSAPRVGNGISVCADWKAIRAELSKVVAGRKAA
jgi:putative hydrolase of the HAD superfamily